MALLTCFAFTLSTSKSENTSLKVHFRSNILHKYLFFIMLKINKSMLRIHCKKMNKTLYLTTVHTPKVPKPRAEQLSLFEQYWTGIMSTYLTLSGYFESNSVRVFLVLKVLLLLFINELFESLNAHTYFICHVLNSQHWNLVLLCATRSIRIARAV